MKSELVFMEPFSPEEDAIYDGLLRECHEIRSLKVQDVYRNVVLFDRAKNAQENAEKILDLYQTFIKIQTHCTEILKMRLSSMIAGRSRYVKDLAL